MVLPWECCMLDRTNRRRFLKTTGAAATVGLLAGCSDDGGDGSDGGDGGDGGSGGSDGGSGGSDGGSGGSDGGDSGDDDVFPDTLRIGHPSPARPAYNVATYTTFLERLEDRGVTIEPKTFSGFTGVIAGMVSDEVDVAYVTPPSLINASREGFPISAFCELSQRFSQQVISVPEVDSWDELEGETLVAHSPQSFSALVLRAAVMQNLGSVDAVDYRYIIGTPNRMAAIEEGETQATTVFLSGALAAEQEGYAKIFNNPNDDFDPMTLAQWAAMDDQIEENEEMYREFTREMLAAYEEFYERDSADLAQGTVNAPTGFPDFGVDIWEQTIDAAKDDRMYPTDPADISTDEKFRKSIDLALKTGLIEEDIDPGTLTDRRFLEELE